MHGPAPRRLLATFVIAPDVFKRARRLSRSNSRQCILVDKGAENGSMKRVAGSGSTL
jgi:hypothetical protein